MFHGEECEKAHRRSFSTAFAPPARGAATHELSSSKGPVASEVPVVSSSCVSGDGVAPPPGTSSEVLSSSFLSALAAHDGAKCGSCGRPTYNGRTGASCCQSCNNSYGRKHGEACERRCQRLLDALVEETAPPAASTPSSSSPSAVGPLAAVPPLMICSPCGASGEPSDPAMPMDKFFAAPPPMDKDSDGLDGSGASSATKAARAKCRRSGCDRYSFDGTRNNPCCWYCESSNGEEHGKSCDTKYNKYGPASPEPSSESEDISNPGDDSNPGFGLIPSLVSLWSGWKAEPDVSAQGCVDLKKCRTPFCERRSWNGKEGQTCCLTCETWSGKKHGKNCEEAFGKTVRSGVADGKRGELSRCQERALENVRKSARPLHDAALPGLRSRACDLVPGTTEGEFDQMLNYINKEAPVIVHIKPENLRKLVNDPEHLYRSLFETKTGGGCTNCDARARWEKEIFQGAYERSSPKERPKYGCLNFLQVLGGVASAGQYGKWFIQLRPSIRSRLTISPQDSAGVRAGEMGTLEYSAHILAKLSDKEFKSLLQSTKTKKVDVSYAGSYRECQIHGDLRMEEDVVALFVKNADSPENRKLIEDFQGLSGCKVYRQEDGSEVLRV